MNLSITIKYLVVFQILIGVAILDQAIDQSIITYSDNKQLALKGEHNHIEAFKQKDIKEESLVTKRKSEQKVETNKLSFFIGY